MDSNIFDLASPRISDAVWELDAGVRDIARITSDLKTLSANTDTVESSISAVEVERALILFSDAIAVLDEAAYELSQEKQS